MRGFQHSSAGLLLRANPHGPASAKEAEWVLANQLRWTFQTERDCGCRIPAKIAVLVGDTHRYTRAVGAIGDEFCVVCCNHELPIKSFVRIELFNYLLSSEITFNLQSSFLWSFVQIHLEGRMQQIPKRCTIGIRFCDHSVTNVKLEMVAIGADDRSFHHLAPVISRRPLKRGFQHDLL